jgi:hypothetical protein
MEYLLPNKPHRVRERVAKALLFATLTKKAALGGDAINISKAAKSLRTTITAGLSSKKTYRAQHCLQGISD